MARALADHLPAGQLVVVVNVGDDDDLYGVRVCPDLDTVMYTLAGIEGPHGWGIRDDTFCVMDRLAELGVDTTFRLGDRDLATCLARSAALQDGNTLTDVTRELAANVGVDVPLYPATDAALRTWIQTEGGEWLAFQEYFVIRGHRDPVRKVIFEGTMAAAPPEGVVEAIEAADLIVIAPSNPVLSIWPILAVAGIRRAVEEHDRVVAVSPLFGGKTLRGPAATLLAAQGFPAGNAGVLAAYEGLLSDLVVDEGDRADATLPGDEEIHVANTRIGEPDAGARFGAWLLDRMNAP